jgi:hypothetical protein
MTDRWRDVTIWLVSGIDHEVVPAGIHRGKARSRSVHCIIFATAGKVSSSEWRTMCFDSLIRICCESTLRKDAGSRNNVCVNYIPRKCSEDSKLQGNLGPLSRRSQYHSLEVSPKQPCIHSIQSSDRYRLCGR